jgi:hypothetical protein
MTAADLIKAVEELGGSLRVDGEWLVIKPKVATPEMRTELRRHKAEIIAILHARTMAPVLIEQPEVRIPEGALLERWELLPPPIELLGGCTVVDVDLYVRTTLRQVDAHLRGESSWRCGNWPLWVLLERLEMCGCVLRLVNPKRAHQ